MVEIYVPDFENGYGSCPDHGRQQLTVSTTYIDPSQGAGGFHIGFGGSSYVYKCPKCDYVLGLREKINYYGPSFSGSYTEEDLDKLRSIKTAAGQKPWVK